MSYSELSKGLRYSRVLDIVERCWISYRALFTWLNPLGYISSRILKPVGLTIGFSALTYSYGQSVDYALIGASILSGVTALLFGSSLAVGNERNYGTLPYWMSSPVSKIGDMLVRILPHWIDGVVSGFITYLVAGSVFNRFPVAPYVFILLLGACVTASLGIALCLAAASLLVTDVFIIPNIMQLLMMLSSGALVPVASLPGPVAVLGTVFPQSHIMLEVSRLGAANEPALIASEQLWTWTVGLGVGWLVFGFLFSLLMVTLSQEKELS